MLDSLANPDAEGLGGTQLLESVRFQAATMFHSEPGRVALLKSTSEGLGLLAQGLDWRAGDEVIVYERDFLGCLAPFLPLEDIGVCVRLVPDLGRYRFDLDDLERLLTPRTRAVCLSVVNRATGMRAPVEAIGDVCRDRGLWYALDAAQALGVHRIVAPNLNTDIVAATATSSRLRIGVAPTYCSERALAELRVPQIGWKNTRLAATEPNGSSCSP